MLERIIHVLVETDNEAADDLLLGAVDAGSDKEAAFAMDALFRRQTLFGMSGLIGRYDNLAESLKLRVLENIGQLASAIRACAGSGDIARRLSALRLIARGRQGKLAYLLIESMHHSNEDVARAAIDALVALARWVATETRRVQNAEVKKDLHGDPIPPNNPVYREVIEQRSEIEATVNRAIDIHRGAYVQELLRAALLLADRPESKTLSILHTAKHGGEVPMVRRLQQTPASEHVEAFLLAASHMDLRGQFGLIFSRIDETPVLDALLRRTYWLKDHHLRICMQQVSRCGWLDQSGLQRDINKRSGLDLGRIGEWITATATHDAMQDELLVLLAQRAADHFGARLRLLRIAARRPRGASVQLLRTMLQDSDERIVRMAVREFIRRKPADYENTLLQLMSNAPDSVRRIVGRSVGQSGFDNFWERFDDLEPATRQTAGRAMVKLVPGTKQRLSRLMTAGTTQDRLKALQIAQELNLSHELHDTLLIVATDSNPKLRSKAVILLGQTPTGLPELLVDKALNDPDSRVRANVIEVIDQRKDPQYLPMLSRMAQSRHNRERANAIKALLGMRMGSANQHLIAMLKDSQPEHRISALWALKQVGLWQMLREIANLAKSDSDTRVRRYALGVIRTLAANVNEKKVSA